MGYETTFIHPADVLSQLPFISSCSITSEQEPRWQHPAPARRGCCAQLLLLPPAPPGPTPTAPWHRGFPCPEEPCAKNVKKQPGPSRVCASQFFTSSLLQAQRLKLCLCWCIPEAPVLSCPQNISEMRNAVLPQARRTNPFFSQY